jgi:vacuolar-type H+-ATPase subunit I/STV1
VECGNFPRLGKAGTRQSSQCGAATVRALANNYDEEQLPLFTQENGLRSAAQLGWDCQELIIRIATSRSEQEDASIMSEKKAKSGNLVIEAKLNSSIDTVVRYQAAIKRDFYRAIATLRDVQRERVAKNGAKALPVSRWMTNPRESRNRSP